MGHFSEMVGEASELRRENERMRKALTEIAEGDIMYLKTPSGNPEPGRPGWWGHLARTTLAAR